MPIINYVNGFNICSLLAIAPLSIRRSRVHIIHRLTGFVCLFEVELSNNKTNGERGEGGKRTSSVMPLVHAL